MTVAAIDTAFASYPHAQRVFIETMRRAYGRVRVRRPERKDIDFTLEALVGERPIRAWAVSGTNALEVDPADLPT